MNVSLISPQPEFTRHPKDQIIGDINSATQTRRMTKISEEYVMVSYINKHRRTNHKDHQNCLFAYFLSQIEPKKVTQALTDPSWIEAMQEELLQSMIGSLMYLTASRPNIMFAVCACARFQVTPKVSHLHAVKRIFRYLKVIYLGAILDRKSTTGSCQFLGKRLISWQCKKQTIVANSTTEAEYVAAAN
ncbi:hypothetical protein Tco_0673982 [Tanacetum coccineum]